MAKPKKAAFPAGKGKMTVVMFQLEGSDETLQEGFDAIKHGFDSITNPTPVLPPVRRAPVALPAGNSEDEPEVFEQDSEHDEVEEVVVSSEPRKRTRDYKTPEILELDLDKTSPTLSEFAAQHGNPTTRTKRYLIIAAWLKEHRRLEEFGAAHLYSCLRFMDWSAHKDVLQPVRVMKSSKSSFSNGSEQGLFAINMVGLEEVRKLRNGNE